MSKRLWVLAVIVVLGAAWAVVDARDAKRLAAATAEAERLGGLGNPLQRRD